MNSNKMAANRLNLTIQLLAILRDLIAIDIFNRSLRRVVRFDLLLYKHNAVFHSTIDPLHNLISQFCTGRH